MPKQLTLAQRVARAGHKITIADLEADPEALIAPRDLAALGLVKSYGGIKRWIDRGWLPVPILLPNGRVVWTARKIAAIYSNRGGRAT